MRPTRLWRARKRHDHLDAVLRHEPNAAELALLLNDRILFTQTYRSVDAAESAAEGTLRELQRAGWNTHW